MKKKIFFIVVFSCLVFSFFTPIYAEDVVDKTPPTGTILINDGVEYTNNRNVTLTLSAEDVSGVSEMRIANYNSYHDWEPYSTTKVWILSDSDILLKTVRVQFKDKAGNINDPGIFTTITLDTVVPVINLIGDAIVNLKVGDTYNDQGATALDNGVTNLTTSIIKGGTIDTSTAGTYTITYDISDNAGNHAIQVTRTVIVNSIPSVKTESFVIRNGDVIVFEGTRLLPESKTIKIPDSKSVEHDINSRSVLAILYDIDQTENSFAISNLDYNAGLGSLYVKCLTPSLTNSLCENWQYTVNNIYPGVGMDKNILAGNERIYIYFGPQNKTLLSKNSITNEEELKVTTEKYDYENNLWVPRNNATVGLTQPNPDDQWSPIDDIKTAVDPITGIVTFSSIPIGEYDVGVKEDYYWPTEKLTVTEATHNNDGGGGNPPILHHKVDIDNALRYLSEKQNPDGSFSSDLYTDWIAIAAEAGNNSNLKSKIINYFKNNPLDSLITTDNERHAMALMSLGINPYSGTEINYIQKIVDAFDGTQFGDSSLVNDDIFALIVLANAGYSSSDEIISKDVKYLLDPLKQPLDGFWGSIDMTSAVIQALKPFSDLNGANEAISLAKNYLINSQQPDGGFNNSSSTSWVLQAIKTLGEDSSNSTWIKNNLNPNDYLFTLQQIDGGVESLTSDEDTRIWATSYAIPAVMGKSWGDIMQSFQKPVTENNSSASVSENTDSQTSNNPVVCPRGDLFSTITGQACTTTDETNIITINTPINNQNPDLVKKIEDKKSIEVPKVKNIRKSDFLKISESPTPEVSVENNLGASVENATPIEISVKKISQIVINSVIDILTYIGKGFYDLIIFLPNKIGAVFR